MEIASRATEQDLLDGNDRTTPGVSKSVSRADNLEVKPDDTLAPRIPDQSNLMRASTEARTSSHQSTAGGSLRVGEGTLQQQQRYQPKLRPEQTEFTINQIMTRQDVRFRGDKLNDRDATTHKEAVQHLERKDDYVPTNSVTTDDPEFREKIIELLKKKNLIKGAENRHLSSSSSYEYYTTSTDSYEYYYNYNYNTEYNRGKSTKKGPYATNQTETAQKEGMSSRGHDPGLSVPRTETSDRKPVLGGQPESAVFVSGESPAAATVSQRPQTPVPEQSMKGGSRKPVSSRAKTTEVSQQRVYEPQRQQDSHMSPMIPTERDVSDAEYQKQHDIQLTVGGIDAGYLALYPNCPTPRNLQFMSDKQKPLFEKFSQAYFELYGQYPNINFEVEPTKDVELLPPIPGHFKRELPDFYCNDGHTQFKRMIPRYHDHNCAVQDPSPQNYKYWCYNMRDFYREVSRGPGPAKPYWSSGLWGSSGADDGGGIKGFYSSKYRSPGFKTSTSGKFRMAPKAVGFSRSRSCGPAFRISNKLCLRRR